VNAENLVSWLMHSERLLPIFWVLLLAASSAAAFFRTLSFELATFAKRRPEALIPIVT